MANYFRLKLCRRGVSVNFCWFEVVDFRGFGGVVKEGAVT